MVENVEHRLGRAIVLRLESGRPLTVLTPAWAALAGLLVSGAAGLNVHTLVILVLLILLVEPLMGSLWELAISQQASSLGEVRVLAAPAALPAAGPEALVAPAIEASVAPPVGLDPVLVLPYARAGSPVDRLASGLAGAAASWQAMPWRRSAFLLHLAFALAIAAVLGSALPLMVVALAVIGLRLFWRGALPAMILAAVYDMSLPWLLGMAALGQIAWRDWAQYKPALLLVLAYSIVYLACLIIAHGGRLPILAVLDAAQATVLLYLLARQEALAVWLLGLCLIAQLAAQASFLGGQSGRAYLLRAALFIALGMVVAALALAPASIGQ